MQRLTIRNTSLVGLALCILSFMFGYYLQWSFELSPCLLCHLQRLLLIILAFCFLYTTLLYKRKNLLLPNSLIFIFGLFGTLVSVRHIWLQTFSTEQTSACLPSLSYMLKYFPLKEAWHLLLASDGCAEVQWQFLTLSIPQWTLIVFILLAAIGLWNILQIRKQRKP